MNIFLKDLFYAVVLWLCGIESIFYFYFLFIFSLIAAMLFIAKCCHLQIILNGWLSSQINAILYALAFLLLYARRVSKTLSI